MDFATPTHLRDHSKWTGLYRLLLIEIELYATGTSHTAYPSIETLAAERGVSASQLVQEWLWKALSDRRSSR
jgi:hypothetical protein